MAIHEATRRELLTGSGALFAWVFVPKIARAEGRDPRFLTLYEKRDLKATIDLRAVLKGVLKDHLRAPDRALAETIFPDSAAVPPLEGLVG